MVKYFRVFWKILFYFRGYRPQSVTLFSVWRWLSQFPTSTRKHLYLLLDHIFYFSEQATIKSLIELNNSVLARLRLDEIYLDNVIYVAIDSAGSSSQVMLSLLRDAENLERRGANLVGSRDVQSIEKLTSQIQTGAIIYIDDFSGSGKQFCDNRNFSAQFIVGAFSEFFIAPVICEESCKRIESTGVVPVAGFLHTINQRPLHRDSKILPTESKAKIINLCNQMHPRVGLGFKKLATMVVFYRNAPNSMPLLFRGNLQQSPYKGIFPRTDDLPFKTNRVPQPDHNIFPISSADSSIPPDISSNEQNVNLESDGHSDLSSSSIPSCGKE